MIFSNFSRMFCKISIFSKYSFIKLYLINHFVQLPPAQLKFTFTNTPKCTHTRLAGDRGAKVTASDLFINQADTLLLFWLGLISAWTSLCFIDLQGFDHGKQKSDRRFRPFFIKVISTLFRLPPFITLTFRSRRPPSAWDATGARIRCLGIRWGFCGHGLATPGERPVLRRGRICRLGRVFGRNDRDQLVFF